MSTFIITYYVKYIDDTLSLVFFKGFINQLFGEGSRRRKIGHARARLLCLGTMTRFFMGGIQAAMGRESFRRRPSCLWSWLLATLE